MTFFESIHCASRAHCGVCRDTAHPTFRESIAAAYSLPVVNFECPHGVPWDYKPESVASPLLSAQDAQPARLGDTLAALFHWCGVRKRPGCGCAARQAWANHNQATVYMIVGIAAYVAFTATIAAWLA